jgi:tetratricopeptide (TPR) repeat protein
MSERVDQLEAVGDDKSAESNVLVAEPETKKDANDYSRFDDVNDDTISSDEDDIKITVEEAVSRANVLKDEGNNSFKRAAYADALNSYEEGIKLLESHKDAAETKTLLVSLYGNVAMVQLKLEDYSKAHVSASSVLAIESDNVKALFRRAVAYHNVGRLEDAKLDLARTLELDAGNAAAAKELAEVNKKLKEAKQKEKAAFSSMFKKSMYEDRERERAEKLRKEEEEKQRLQDEWTKSKLERRAKGLEEQTFDDWKKERDEEAKKAKEENEKKRFNSSKEAPPKTKKADSTKSEKSNEDEEEEEYDEEEAKIIAETKAKGYCYFRKEQCKYRRTDTDITA